MVRRARPGGADRPHARPVRRTPVVAPRPVRPGRAVAAGRRPAGARRPATRGRAPGPPGAPLRVRARGVGRRAGAAVGQRRLGPGRDPAGAALLVPGGGRPARRRRPCRRAGGGADGGPLLRDAGGLRLTGPGAPAYVRRSCCLYYRVPGGGLCGDCALR
ncbi:(2Fe-2S)-binding protein [Actinacidiphila glaucinigra]|uniref:(2Fe-2S)-binding protein n=1 Tax=Actinacidiphila glaucinigra TaxID=235986 RepID=UPI003D907674